MYSEIAFVCNGFPTLSETFIFNQINHAFSCGYKIQIHGSYLNKDQEKFLPENLINAGIMDNVVLNHNAPDDKGYRLTKALKLARNAKELTALFKSIGPIKFGLSGPSLRNFYSISSFLNSNKPDIVHAHFGPNGVKAVNARMAGLIDCPVITSFHGYDAYINSAGNSRLERDYRNLFKYGDAFLVNGDFLRARLIGLGCPANKIIVMPLGINHQIFNRNSAPPIRHDQMIKLITVGRLIPLKNQKLGIRILAWLIEHGWTASYTIIGEGPELENLQNLARKLGVEEYIYFMGSQTPLEVANTLQEHDIFLMTSDQDNEGRMETQGLVTAEAQACGLPVVVLGMGGTKDTLKPNETGFIIEGKSKEEIIEIMEYLMQPEIYEKFSKAAIDFAHDQFNIEKNNLALERLYNTLKENYKFQSVEPNSTILAD